MNKTRSEGLVQVLLSLVGAVQLRVEYHFPHVILQPCCSCVCIPDLNLNPNPLAACPAGAVLSLRAHWANTGLCLTLILTLLLCSPSLPLQVLLLLCHCSDFMPLSNWVNSAWFGASKQNK